MSKRKKHQPKGKGWEQCVHDKHSWFRVLSYVPWNPGGSFSVERPRWVTVVEYYDSSGKQPFDEDKIEQDYYYPPHTYKDAVDLWASELLGIYIYGYSRYSFHAKL